MNWSFSSLFLRVGALALASLLNWHLAAAADLCEGDLGRTGAQIEAILLAQRDPLFREKILARKTSRDDIQFEVTEFRPLLEEMKRQLDNLKKRAKATFPLNPLNFKSRFVTVPREVDRLQVAVDRLLDSKITYWSCLELAVDFEFLADRVVALEGGQDDWWSPLSRTLTREILLNRLRRLVSVFPVIFVPTLTPLSEETFNHVWSRGILPLGVVTHVMGADRTLWRPTRFFDHDLQHADFIFTYLLKFIFGEQTGPNSVFDSRSPISVSISDEQYGQIDRLFSQATFVLNRFLWQVNQLNDEHFKWLVHFSFFHSDHETNSFLAKHPLTGELLEKESQIWTHTYVALPSTVPENAMSEADRTQRLKEIQNWILSKWKWATTIEQEAF